MNNTNSAANRNYHIGVLGHYGHSNMGDEAIIEAVIRNLRKRCPTIQVSGFSINPEDTARRYGIPAYPIRRQKPDHSGNPVDVVMEQEQESRISRGSGISAARDFLKRFALLRVLVHLARFMLGLPRVLWRESVFLRDAYRIVRNLDSLIVAGSNQFLDNFGGVWGYPYNLLKWTVLARCAGARVVFLSVGAGPIKSLWSRLMVRTSLLLADYVSFRDEGSRNLIRWFGSDDRWRVYPDLAQSLPHTLPPARDDVEKPVVAINPMPVYDRRNWCEPDDARYERYVGQLTGFVTSLLRGNYPFFFFTTQPSDSDVIDDVVARIDSSLVSVHGAPERKTSITVSGLMDVLASADIVVATRYHGTILGLHARRPVLGISYYRKTREVLEAMGQGQYAMDLDDLDHEVMWQQFEILVSKRREEARIISRYCETASVRLDEQYDDVLEILGVPTDVTMAAGRKGDRAGDPWFPKNRTN